MFLSPPPPPPLCRSSGWSSAWCSAAPSRGPETLSEHTRPPSLPHVSSPSVPLTLVWIRAGWTRLWERGSFNSSSLVQISNLIMQLFLYPTEKRLRPLQDGDVNIGLNVFHVLPEVWKLTGFLQLTEFYFVFLVLLILDVLIFMKAELWSFMQIFWWMQFRYISLKCQINKLMNNEVRVWSWVCNDRCEVFVIHVVSETGETTVQRVYRRLNSLTDYLNRASVFWAEILNLKLKLNKFFGPKYIFRICTFFFFYIFYFLNNI